MRPFPVNFIPMNRKTFSAPLLGLLTTLALATTALSGCKKDVENTDPVSAPASSLLTAVQANPDLTLFAAAALKTGLGPTLSSNADFTIFAPNNAAFAALSTVTGLARFARLDSIVALNPAKPRDAADITALRNVLLYHIVSGDRKAATLISGPVASQRGAFTPRSADTPIYLTVAGGVVTLNAGAARVTGADAANTENGTVHVINAVLLPPSLTALALVNALGSAATNPRFALLRQALLRDTVAQVLGAAASSVPGSVGNANANLTIFAPNDAAFRALLVTLNRPTLARVTAPVLLSVLRGHIVSGQRLLATDLTTGRALTALNGTLTIGRSGNSVTVVSNGNTARMATVTAADILTTNAVIHEIDQVLLP